MRPWVAVEVQCLSLRALITIQDTCSICVQMLISRVLGFGLGKGAATLPGRACVEFPWRVARYNPNVGIHDLAGPSVFRACGAVYDQTQI